MIPEFQIYSSHKRDRLRTSMNVVVAAVVVVVVVVVKKKQSTHT